MEDLPEDVLMMNGFKCVNVSSPSLHLFSAPFTRSQVFNYTITRLNAFS